MSAEGKGLRTNFDAERRKKAQTYTKKKRILSISNLVITFVLFTILTYLDFGSAFSNFLNTYFNINDLLIQAVIFFFFLMILGFIYSLPFDYISFQIEREFELAVQSLKGWFIDEIKGLGLTAVIGTIVTSVLVFTLREISELWFVVFWIFSLLFFLVMTIISPVLISLFFKIEPMSDDKPIKQKLLDLAKDLGAKVEDVYSISFGEKTQKANAAVIGLGSTRKIILGDTMLDRYTDDEIIAVMAHELSHHVHHDMWRFFLMNSIVSLVSIFLVDLILEFHISIQFLSSKAQLTSLLLIGFWFSVISFFTGIIGNYYSRRRETVCDKYALQYIENPKSLASTFYRLADQNLSNIDPNPIYVILFYDHPPIKERITLCESFKKESLKKE